MKRFTAIISLLLVLSLIFGIVACGQTPAPTTQAPAPTTSAPATTAAPAPTTSKPVTTAPATTSAPATTAAATMLAAKYILSMAPSNCPAPAAEGSNPPPSGAGLNYLKFAELAATKTNGLVKIDPYWSQSLVPYNQIVSATATGVVDVGGVSPQAEVGKVPLTMVGQLPGFGTDWWAQSMAYWDLMNQDILLAEYAKHNCLPLGVNFVPDYNLISRQPLRTLAELKGKKIAATGITATILNDLGAVPLAMAPPEQYEGMQKGIIDGITATYSPIADFRFYEVGKYIEMFPFGGKMQPTLINKDTWNSLPADVQSALRDMVPDEIQVCIDCFFRKGLPLFPLSEELVKANNLEIIKPSAEDIAALQKVQANISDNWSVEQDKTGLQGSKILADYRALVQKYEKISTFAFK